MEPKAITVKGAREHNLQDVSLKLPRGKLICLTGVSGSGKSSFAFDTLFAEGQRRYLESLSSYARQFLGQLAKPDVDHIAGLSPAISIQQKTGGWNPRSTVGTITQIHDYLRVVFARIGIQHCTKCAAPISAQTRDQLIGRILSLPADSRVALMAPVVRGQKGEYRDLFEDMIRRGYARARVDGTFVSLDSVPALSRYKSHDIEIVVDRVSIGSTARARIAEGVEDALRLGEGTMIVHTFDEDSAPSASSPPRAKKRRSPRQVRAAGGQAGDRLFSSRYACMNCDIGLEPPSPQMLSFNAPAGMCLTCHGLGTTYDFDPDLLVPDPKKTFLNLAVEPMRTRIGRWRRHIFRAVAQHVGFDLKTPWGKLPARARNALLYGLGDTHLTYEWRSRGGVFRHGGTFEGVIANLRDKHRKAKSTMVRAYYEKYMRKALCAACGGGRVNPQALAIRLGGFNIFEISAMGIREAAAFFQALDLTPIQRTIAGEALKEILARLKFLSDVGLDYLTLDRSAPTLSGGESQRIRLASQIGAGLVGVLYILDEPSIGLHPRDNERLLDSLCHLRDMGNTVIVVEHDEQTMRTADHIVDFGPGPGVRGGHVVAAGAIEKIQKTRKSITGRYLRGDEAIEIPTKRRPVRKSGGGRASSTARAESRGSGKKTRDADGGEVAWLTVAGARQNNLKNITVEVPLGRFVCVTGVSGSGKSSLVNDIIWQTLARDLNGAVKVHPGRHDAIGGLEHLDKVIDIDQSPIGRTPRSNPATYIKAFDEIRALFAKLPEAKIRGYKPGRFSFNVPAGGARGGRCESCEGNGSDRMEMELLADVWITCPVCQGKRFSHETLQILFKGKSIIDVLNMDVQDALTHFEHVPRIAHMLSTLHEVGLDYLKLGQSATTLSGGEAQRIKLARELVKKSTGQTLYILDEPTTGLHFADIKKLLAVLHGFVDAGNTVLVIEHNLDVVKTADWVIDLGPEGGADGGRIVAAGTPEEIARSPRSQTGIALKGILNHQDRSAAATPRKPAPRPRRKAAANGHTRLAKTIRVVGARQHNLKDIDVDIPRGKTTVCAGPSGSGKSSFAMDTVYTEGQRRYVESLSAYARQFLGRMAPPRVDHVYGLSPSVCIEQKNTSQSPRSTVGTVTEIYDYMRVLWARIGRPQCPTCHVPVGTQDVDEIAAQVLALPEGTRALILAPIHPVGQESFDALLARQKAQGYRRVRIDGVLHALDNPPAVSKRGRHETEVVVDRVTVQPNQRARIAESVELALSVGNGVVLIQTVASQAAPARADGSSRKDEPVRRYSQHRSCSSCHRAFEELTPHHFSFNARLGWCPACEGIGTQQGAGASAIIVHPTRSIAKGAVCGWGELVPGTTLHRFVEALAAHLDLDLDTPYNELQERHQQAILQGCGDDWIAVDAPRTKGPKLSDGLGGLRFQWRGFFPAIAKATRASWKYRKRLQSMATDVACHACGGSRLRQESAAVLLGGRTIRETCDQSLAASLAWFESLSLNPRDREIAGELLHEITSRLRFLVEVGLDYVSLNRTASTLSGGESQRIQLASQIGTGLTGVLYVLDEPTIGLHPRDNGRLIRALRRLRDLGNTLLMVEHDRDVIDSADYVLDFGPAAGQFGGEITAAATPSRIRRMGKSLTGQYLANKASIAVPSNRRPLPKHPPRTDLEAADDADANRAGHSAAVAWLTVCGAREHNLKEIDAAFPLGRFTCVTGVSGSGKSTLVNEILHKALARRIHRASARPGGHDRMLGAEHIDKVINVDQAPIGISPTSNPATYTGLFDLIRALYTKLPTSKVRGYSANRFSFNRPGGRCEACSGMGMRCVEMHFLPDVWIECESCKGKRFLSETLDVRFHGKSIADVLEMRVSQAIDVFADVPKVYRMLETLSDVGLDYVQLGQAAPMLSGGEAQRVKLAAELGRPSTGKTLYILDEPTTGLHFDDLKKLLGVLHRLVDLGNTCICIEHNLDVIKTADWIIDLGPEAGAAGGDIVACGTPERIASSRKSHTGKALSPVLKAGPVRERAIHTVGDRPAAPPGAISLIPGDDVKMPWEEDGRRWHTVDHTDSKGQPAAWDGDLLVWLVETIESLGTFEPTDWNHRTRVEITAVKNKQWFAHFLTGGSDLVDVAFRVPEGSFTTAALSRKLAIPTLDERSDLPLYGQWNRCRVRPVGNGWSAIRLALRDFKDFKKTAFRSFLRDAQRAYRSALDSAAADPHQGKPWKQDGQGWHLGQKAARRRHVLQWRPDLIMTVVGKLKLIEPALTEDWNQESAILFSVPGEAKIAGKIVTNLGRGLRLELRAPAGAITPAMIDRLGDDSEIRERSNTFWVTFWIRSINQTDWKQFRDVWSRCRVISDKERLQSA